MHQAPTDFISYISNTGRGLASIDHSPWNKDQWAQYICSIEYNAFINDFLPSLMQQDHHQLLKDILPILLDDGLRDLNDSSYWSVLAHTHKTKKTVFMSCIACAGEKSAPLSMSVLLNGLSVFFDGLREEEASQIDFLRKEITKQACLQHMPDVLLQCLKTPMKLTKEGLLGFVLDKNKNLKATQNPNDRLKTLNVLLSFFPIVKQKTHFTDHPFYLISFHPFGVSSGLSDALLSHGYRLSDEIYSMDVIYRYQSKTNKQKYLDQLVNDIAPDLLAYIYEQQNILLNSIELRQKIFDVIGDFDNNPPSKNKKL